MVQAARPQQVSDRHGIADQPIAADFLLVAQVGQQLIAPDVPRPFFQLKAKVIQIGVE